VLRFNEPNECRELLERHGHRLAAVLLDPLASRVGMVPATEEFRSVLQDTCRRLGILLVMDEVISFRLGYGGAHTVFGLKPDLVALAISAADCRSVRLRDRRATWPFSTTRRACRRCPMGAPSAPIPCR
jgi:acetylornithine/succinyldiaminopimelate/putrescine aminotransferase